jgi:predicted transport protein
MPLFSINQGKLDRINKISFKLEKDIQKLTEKNLNEIFGLEFVRTEFQLNNLRIDSLAFDNETNSFVIIEYKRDKNFSVIDQGYAYLALLLNNKAEFILEYNELKEKYLKREDIDWSQSRVIFVSPQFTKYQQQAIEFKDLPIELWEISKYTNETVLFNQLKSPDTSESINTVSSKSKAVQKVSKEVKKYNEEDHLNNTSEEIAELYSQVKERIIELGDNIEIKPLKIYIAFKSSKNFVYTEFTRNTIKLCLNLKKGSLDDPKNMAKDVSNIGHHGNGDYEINLTPEDDLDYLMTLIKQSYKKNSF